MDGDEIIDWIEQHNWGHTDVVMVSVCIEEEHFTRIWDWWGNTMVDWPDFCLMGNQCTSMVCQSIDTQCRPWKLLSPQRWFDMTRRGHHRCGPNKGALAELEVFHETDWTTVPLPQ